VSGDGTDPAVCYTTPMAADPVRARRAQVARYTALAKRIGYGLWLVAIAVYAYGVVTTFTETVSAVVIGCLVVGSVVLAPAIILGYAVKAAERHDRELGH
jgi:hypothetical protein